MGPFRLFSRKNNQNQDLAAEGHDLSASNPSAGKLTIQPAFFEKGLDTVYAFFLNDYESRGYNDALTNPDESYKSDNIKLLNHELFILIERTSSYYEDLAREIEFHISTRSRAGLIDLVEELKIRQQIINEHRAKLSEIKKEALTGTGAIERLGLSYQRGFMRGLSSISQAKVLNNR